MSLKENEVGLKVKNYSGSNSKLQKKITPVLDSISEDSNEANATVH